jgi:DNA mismatch endonuclease, patch repair protein
LSVFCDGDFWHGRDWQALSDKLKAGSNASYWVEKIRSNRVRDLKNVESLRQSGWMVFRFWESEIQESVEEIGILIAQKLREIEAQQNPPIAISRHRYLGRTP